MPHCRSYWFHSHFTPKTQRQRFGFMAKKFSAKPRYRKGQRDPLNKFLTAQSKSLTIEFGVCNDLEWNDPTAIKDIILPFYFQESLCDISYSFYYAPHEDDDSSDFNTQPSPLVSLN